MKILKVVLPIAIVAGATLGAVALVASREAPATRIPEAVVPLVRVQTVELQDLTLTVESQGTVRPRTESTLVPEVSGRVIEISPSFVPGGFFDAGETLLRIDPHDYRQALVEARARVAQAELRLAQQRAESELARQEWAELGQGEAIPLTLREPQVAEAEALLEAARAALQRAQRDLERTRVRAPYAGRVGDKQADLGQFVMRGTPAARIYSIDAVEVRLPLEDRQLAFLDLPLGYRDGRGGPGGPRVELRAEFGGKEHRWSGRIVRTEGEIDPVSRLVHIVARIDDPYARSNDPDRPPLAPGMFVQAAIEGRHVRDVALIPRSVVRDDGTVLVVDEEDRLRFRPVDVLRSRGEQVIVSDGLRQGERLCLSPLTAVTDGMRVRTPDDAATTTGDAATNSDLLGIASGRDAGQRRAGAGT